MARKRKAKFRCGQVVAFKRHYSNEPRFGKIRRHVNNLYNVDGWTACEDALRPLTRRERRA